jgi:hypothetical protein
MAALNGEPESGLGYAAPYLIGLTLLWLSSISTGPSQVLFGVFGFMALVGRLLADLDGNLKR